MKLLKQLSKRWYILIGLLIFLYIILYKIDSSKVFKILTQANPFFICAAILSTLSMILIQPIRWNYIKKVQNIKYSFKDSFFIYSASFFFSSITPGRIGDFIKIFYLKKDGHSIGKSLASIILDRMADVLFLLFLSYLGLIFFFDSIRKELFLLTLLSIIILSIFIVLRKNGIFKILFDKISKTIIPFKYQKSWHLNYMDFVIGLKKYQLKNYLILVLFTLLTWTFYYGTAFSLAKSIDMNNIPFFFFITSIALSALASLLPISILGLGTRDASLLFFFSSLGISPEKIISFSVLFLLIVLIAILIGFFSWLKKPLKFK